jgi:KUP system potassium uptake protein
VLGKLLFERTLPVDLFLKSIERQGPTRVPGTAVYMHSGRDATPPALLHNLKHNKVLHEHVFLLSVETQDVPHVPREERVQVEEIGAGIKSVRVSYGFAQDPHIPAALAHAASEGLLTFKPMETTYFLGRERLRPVKQPPMILWRARLFALMSRNATGATDFFQLPPNRVVELGTQLEI